MFDTIGNVYYAMFVAFWGTLFVESWKRKQAVIADRWLMRGYVGRSSIRSDYVATASVSEATGTEKRVSFTNTSLVFFLVALPVQILFFCAVIACQVGMRYWFL